MDNVLQQRIQQLEQSVADYRSTNTRLQSMLDAADADNAIGGPKRTRKDLVREIDTLRITADKATKGMAQHKHIHLASLNAINYRSARSAGNPDAAGKQD